VVAAPLVEETLFRGVLFRSFRAKWGVAPGILLSAVVFGLMHPFPFYFLPIFVLGSVFASLTYIRGSLLPSMVAHGINNLVAFTMMYILIIS
jgi:membrane protease YdiL (CAAX protease family)